MFDYQCLNVRLVQTSHIYTVPCFIYFQVMDEEECERKRDECLLDMMELEKLFSLLREQYVSKEMFHSYT